jgi:hypothetical protein
MIGNAILKKFFYLEIRNLVTVRNNESRTYSLSKPKLIAI